MNLSSLSKAALFNLCCVICGTLALWIITEGNVAKSFWGCFALLLFSLCTLLYIYNTRRQLQEISEICRQVAEGNFEPRILLGNARGEMRNLILSINCVFDTADAFMRETSATLQHAGEGKYYRKIVTTGLHGAYRRGAETINKGMDDIRHNMQRSMESAAEKLMGAADSAAQEAEKLKSSASVTSETINNVAAATEELSASIKEISSNIEYSRGLANNAVEKAEHIDTVLAELVKSEESITHILSLIEGITSKINLLALNATIEAARAGEAGKGFAVVANEVKVLAGQTGNATADIAQSINNTRTEIDKTVQSIRSIGALIANMNEMTTTIASSIQEQSMVTQEIAASINRAATYAAEIADAARNVADSATLTDTAAREMYASVGSAI